ncbi:structure-specific recognition protein-domain-containing protein [Fomitopsis serialis]|uniref:structure-specific recognition protein-domain-containing protein n=1 Tax=Fomitopsis serialis TaxID=139415 RepID=UPI002007490B|nr:structure-specific recognition protein-domain-containing protein [Neoantrodia serialis]KAH9936566.1 structure-specific recognition protein-domain-containing protein [Neoantrodia serialis]
MTTQFDRIYHGLSPELGKFRIAASGMAWKGEESEKMVAMSSGDIKWAQWLRVARNYQLRVGLKDRSREVFDGFGREDHEKLAQLLKQHFSVTLETKEVSFKGWNWGVTDFQGQDLAFLVSNKTSFELPLSEVANSNIAGRTEVSLEFAPPSGSKKSKGAPDEMAEIRFYVPGTVNRERGSDAGSQKSDDEEEEISAAQAFHDAIKEKAEIGQVAGDLILSFEEVLVLTPRGRYDVDMFPDFLRLRGKTYDYKIMYTSISRLFLLPKDDQHVLFILSLSTPIRQGQTRYQYLVMQFSREEEITAELNMTEYVVSGVFRALSGKKIIGAGSFTSHAGHPGIKANLKAVQGDLFLLEKYIFFVSKQPTLIELSDIHQVVFSRLGAGLGATAARTFDLKIVTKSGPEYTFTSINKEEHEGTEAYLKEKKVKVKNEMMEGELIMAGEDDEDEEMQSVASSGEEVPKPRGINDDEDSEDDEDFHASDSDSGSPTASSSDDEGAKTASDASGDRDFVKGKGKGKAPKKKAPAKKSKADDSDAEDEDKPKKAAPRPKPKPKKKSDDDAMDIDEEPKSKPKPKPKPKPKHNDGEEGPARKKLKKSD